ncbi:MAG: adenylosuccinate synthase, partial [Candidatus Hydrogenedentes bacterium]|nr:adenylosuccinate synthase [Candidatus Hydrogenedentota bacterium]
MPGYAVVGIQWGDEAKGKVVDYLAERVDCVARFQGGNNAGHTVVVNGTEFILHLVPSGVVHPDTTCVIGNGTVVDPRVLLREIEELSARNIEFDGRLWISDSAHIIMPYHRLLDGAEEDHRRQWRVGTTGRGIGPTYTDKVARSGIRAGDLVDESLLREKLVEFLLFKNRLLTEIFKGHDPLDFDEVCREYIEYGRQLAPHICDTTAKLNALIDDGKSVLFEGAQGAMLDIDHGTYPYVTSSNTTAGAVCTGLGIGPTRVNAVIGILKAYTTRVGEGPFPTELTDEIGEFIRKEGGEFGATTGRPRRCGWFDAPVV